MEEYEVYIYIVCWKEPISFDWEWKHKAFANKKEAKLFSRKKKNAKPYPYIIKRITSNLYFKEGTVLELIKQNPTRPVYEATLVKYGNIICENPYKQIKIKIKE